MDNYCVITNQDKDKDLALTIQIAKYLKEHGAECYIAPNLIDEYDNNYTDANLIPTGCECAIVLGGDGTIIQAASDLLERQIPIFGINLGTLGFLADIDQQYTTKALKCLLRDEYEIERRNMLSGVIENGALRSYHGVALNDIVITRAGFSRVITMDVFVNEEHVTSYRGDGVIISTPTGSTGYNLSAGGPIIKPGADATIITPICPHALGARSIIVSASDEIQIRIRKSKKTQLEEAFATFDGRKAIQLKTEDAVIVKRAPEDTRLLKVSKKSFFDILRTKLGECKI